MPIDPNTVKWDKPQNVVWDDEKQTGLYDAPTLADAVVNLGGAAFEPTVSMVTGGLAAIPAGWAGIVTGIANKLGITETDAADVVRSVQEALTYEPKTVSGVVATEAITAPLRVYSELSEDVGGRVTDVAGPAAGTTVNTLLQSAPAALGFRAGGRLNIPPRAQSILEQKAREGIAATIEKHVDPHLLGGTERAVGRLFRDAVGDKAPEVAAALERQPPNPLNIPQNAAQIAADVGSAEFSALQRVLERHNPSPYAAQDISAAAARKAGIQQIGKTPQELNAAISQRAANAKKAYDEAGAEKVKSDSELHDILNRPSGKKSVARAKEIAAESGEAFSGPESYNVRDLHYVKMAMDDMLNTPDQFGIGGAELGFISKTKAQLVKWLGNKSEKYEAARANFAKESAPINQMEVGQALEGKLDAPLVGERAATFARAVKEPPQILKKSTGQARYKELSEVLTQQQMEVVNALMDNLRRDAKYNEQAGQGMQAAQARILAATPYIPPPGMFSPVISASRGWINRLSAKSTGKVLDLMAEIMRNPTPENVAILLRKATPQEKNAVRNIMRLRNRAFVGAAAVPQDEQ